MTIRIINADVLEGLAQLEDESVQCCVTSPPYYGLRDYGVEGQIGLEPTPEAFVEKMVAVFREVKRVLRKDGTLWLNLGDSYCSTAPGTMGDKLNQRGILAGVSDRRAEGSRKPRPDTPSGMKPKDLVGIPWMTAFALRADGWYLRQEIIWHKSNPMPESVQDRCTKAHEHIFLLSKSARYYYDADGIRESSLWPDGPNSPQSIKSPHGQGFTRKAKGWNGSSFTSAQDIATKPNLGTGERVEREGRNKRSVWTIATTPYSEAHFACVDEQTECLTAEGWRRHGDLRPGMLAAQYDIQSGLLSWAGIQDVARYDVRDQDMVVGSCRDMEMWLTPNHRTVIQRRHPRTRALQPPVIVRADELKASHSVPTAAEWHMAGDASLPLEWSELLGWYVAEGHESKDSLAVEIYQSELANSAKCRRIEDLLRQVGAEWTRASCKRIWRGRPADLTAYRILGYAAVRLRELAPDKKVPWSAVLWEQSRVEALVDGLIAGDGHERLDGRRTFVQKDADQCGLMQALAMRLGHSATVSKRADGCSAVYITRHQTRSFRGTNGKGAAPEKRKYSGTVWCPKLPNGTWVARRNGKPFITGNTFPPELPETCIKAGSRIGDMILDPFGGAGTTGLVADQLGRDAILIELNPEYAAMAERRIHSSAPLFAQVETTVAEKQQIDLEDSLSSNP